MTQALRPMTLGEIVDRTFQIYRSRFTTFAAIALLPALAMFVVNLCSSTWLMEHPQHDRVLVYYKSLSGLLWGLVLWLIAGFVQLLARPAFVVATAGSVVGSKRSAYDCWLFVKKIWKPVLALNLFEQIVVILVPGISFILGVLAIVAARRSFGASLSVNAIVLLAIFGLTAAAGALYVGGGLSLSLSFPALVLEENGWIAALRRTWLLVRGVRLRLFILWTMLYLATWLAQLTLRWGMDLLVNAHLRGVPQFHGWSGFSLVLYYLAGALLATAIGPIYPIALTLIYYDQRIRREGFDIEWMMRAAGLNAPETSPAAVRPAAPVSAAPAPTEESPA